MTTKWGYYGDFGACPNCGATVYFGAGSEEWCYPTAAPNYPPEKADYEDSKNWQCWSCYKEQKTMTYYIKNRLTGYKFAGDCFTTDDRYINYFPTETMVNQVLEHLYSTGSYRENELQVVAR
jgi:hypothetical protein